MNRKERTQQNRFEKKLAPLLDELTILCNKFDMPMVAAVQLFTNDEEARIEGYASHTNEMNLAMSLSTSLMNGSTKVRVSAGNMLQLIMPKGELPTELNKYVQESGANGFEDSELESLQQHSIHCQDCKELMEEAISRGEQIDNIVVPPHEDASLIELLNEVRKSKLPFIMPKNNIIH